MSHDLNPENHTAAPDHYLELRSRARSMRYEPTVAELRLWECLRGKQLGVKFRRQHVIGDFIADFVCIEERLIVEVDGEYHQTEQQLLDDEARTTDLHRLGYRVIRFSNQQILGDISLVLNSIQQHFIFTN